MVALANLSRARAWKVAADVLDPELPAVTIGDLGILREIELKGGKVVARLTPTYSGCPAVAAIEIAVDAALRDAGFDPVIERVLTPAWSTDWISDEGRAKLKAYGIAPPQRGGCQSGLFSEVTVPCPQCASTNTRKVSEFGSTACKALYQCDACLEPFDYFKCI